MSDEEEKKFKVNLGSMLQIIEHNSTPETDEDSEDGDTDVLPNDNIIVGIDN